MRVIAGSFRSRVLTSPPGLATRPTSDRLRETLFNILAPSVPGCRFVDLFAGTGAVGIEALSRGAAHVFFAENAASALKSLRANLATLNITGNVTVNDRGVTQLLQKLTPAGGLIDIVFLDPPYDLESAYLQTLGFLGSPGGAKLLAPGAVVVAEHASKSPFALAPRYGVLHQSRTLKQGDASLTFYTPAQPEP